MYGALNVGGWGKGGLMWGLGGAVWFLGFLVEGLGGCWGGCALGFGAGEQGGGGGLRLMLGGCGFWGSWRCGWGAVCRV